MDFRDDRLPKRFWDKVTVNDDTGCWEWTAGRSSGYGAFYDGTRMRGAHRISYEALVGDVPAGLEIDHLCRVPRCVNPAHLEAVTRRENVIRGMVPVRNKERVYVPVTHCKRGHAYSAENLYVFTKPDGRANRVCRTCRLENQRARRARASS